MNIIIIQRGRLDPPDEAERRPEAHDTFLGKGHVLGETPEIR